MKLTTLPLLVLTTLIGISTIHGEILSSIVKEPLRIGAFNIQVFGVTKFGKPDIVQHIIEVRSGCRIQRRKGGGVGHVCLNLILGKISPRFTRNFTTTDKKKIKTCSDFRCAKLF